MQDFFEILRHRHSIHRFQQDWPVEREKLMAVLEAACAAPSAGDLQSYRIVVVEEAALIQRLQGASGGQEAVGTAPLALVFCTNQTRAEKTFGERGRKLFALQDATIATAYAQLAASASGLGSLWVGIFEGEAVHAGLKLPHEYEPIAILCLGYPAERPQMTSRRKLKEMVLYATTDGVGSEAG